MLRTAIFIAVGYLSGSILYARLFCHLFGRSDFMEQSVDGNPGTTNAFLYGGVWCGILTLCGDLLKGIVPVFFYVHHGEAFPENIGLALVVAAPVIGHIFPVFYHFKGGKGIATTFGVLAGLLPNYSALGVFAIAFIFFSIIVKVSPDFYKTIIAYIVTAVAMFFAVKPVAIPIGFCIITVVVLIRLLTSKEEKEKFKLRLLWMK